MSLQQFVILQSNIIDVLAMHDQNNLCSKIILIKTNCRKLSVGFGMVHKWLVSFLYFTG